MQNKIKTEKKSKERERVKDKSKNIFLMFKNSCEISLLCKMFVTSEYITYKIYLSHESSSQFRIQINVKVSKIFRLNKLIFKRRVALKTSDFI